MKFEFCACGASVPVILDFDIEKTTEVNEGEIVCANEGVIDGTVNGGVVLGVAAETHSGQKDILNERANGSKLRVNVTKGAVYSCKAKEITAISGCSATTIKCTDSTFSSSVTGGKLVLVRKAEGSTNSDEIGSVRSISACAVSGNTVTFTVSNGAVAVSGDEYEFYPELSAEMYIDGNASGYAAVNSNTDVKIKCVGDNTKHHRVYFQLKNTLFA